MIGRKTYYQILQVDQGADIDIIGTVHRRLAQRFHPDRDPTPEAERRMQEINQAYDVLKDDARREKYDAELAQRRDRRSGDRYLRRPNEFAVTTESSSPFGEAGPPRGPASGSILDFGRYRGWSLGQIATYDRDFLEWLERSPGGRQFRGEIEQLLRRRV